MKIHCGKRRGSKRSFASSDSRLRRGPWRSTELRTPSLRRKPGRPFSPTTQLKLRPLTSSPCRQSPSAIYIVSSSFCILGVESFISMSPSIRPLNGRRNRSSKRSLTMRLPGICCAIAMAFTASISEIEFEGWGSKKYQPHRTRPGRIHLSKDSSDLFAESVSII